MRAWRIELIAADGGPVGWDRALLRFAAAWLSLAPAGLGLWWSAIDPERRCWHDRLAGTRLVRTRPKASASAPGPAQS